MDGKLPWTDSTMCPHRWKISHTLCIDTLCIERPSGLFHRSIAATVAGEFAAEHPAGRRYQSKAASAVLQVPTHSAANASSIVLRADEGGLAQTW